MKCYLGNLPESLFPLIREYLICGGVLFLDQSGKEDIDSWNKLLNTNKSLFHKPNSIIKARYFYYNLSREQSLAYITCDSRKDRSWVYESIQRIRSEVERPVEQVRLDLSRFEAKQLLSFFSNDSESGVNQVHSLCLNDVKDLRKFPDSFEGKFSCIIARGCTHLTGIASLRGTSYVYLSDCLVEDVNPLQDCQIVRLEFLSYLHDLSCLSGLHSLQLRSCEKVSDVSMLGGLYSLSIYGCPNITDVSALGAVRRLEINTGGTITSFLPYENQIEYLSCSAIYLPELLQFKNKNRTKLCLSDAGIDCNLFVLRGWKEVAFLRSEHHVIDESFINPISDQDILLAKNPSFLRQEVVRRLRLCDTSDLTQIAGLTSLYYLELKRCYDLKEINLGSFSVLKECYLESCSLARITVHGSIERLTIKNHSRWIPVLNVLKQMKQLFIENCSYGGHIRVRGVTDKSFITFVGSPKFLIGEV